MPETLVKAAWLMLAALHVAPAAVLVAPSLVSSLYGAEPDGTAGILLVHRGALFLALVIAGAWATLLPGARPLAAALMAVSIIGFLLVYARAGLPAGPLRTIAFFDLAALVPLGAVAIGAWGKAD